jgi:hypothetical protein
MHDECRKLRAGFASYNTQQQLNVKVVASSPTAKKSSRVLLDDHQSWCKLSRKYDGPKVNNTTPGHHASERGLLISIRLQYHTPPELICSNQVKRCGTKLPSVYFTVIIASCVASRRHGASHNPPARVPIGNNKRLRTGQSLPLSTRHVSSATLCP